MVSCNLDSQKLYSFMQCVGRVCKEGGICNYAAREWDQEPPRSMKCNCLFSIWGAVHWASTFPVVGGLQAPSETWMGEDKHREPWSHSALIQVLKWTQGAEHNVTSKKQDWRFSLEIALNTSASLFSHPSKWLQGFVGPRTANGRVFLAPLFEIWEAAWPHSLGQDTQGTQPSLVRESMILLNFFKPFLERGCCLGRDDLLFS
jgi:hypothetical protein